MRIRKRSISIGGMHEPTRTPIVGGARGRAPLPRQGIPHVILVALMVAALAPTHPAHAATPLPPSALIVDDGDVGFQLFRPSHTGWRTAASTPNDYYNGDVTWTTNVTDTVENYARWSLPVSATLPMTYEVFAFVPRYNSTTQQARYVVNRNGITDTRTINQNSYFGEWVSLGSHVFVTGTNYVELGDATGETAYSKHIGFDAVAFVPHGHACRLRLPCGWHCPSRRMEMCASARPRATSKPSTRNDTTEWAARRAGAAKAAWRFWRLANRGQ